VAYALCYRNYTSRVFDRVVPAWQMIPRMYVSREDQVRGVSPLSTAINSMQDVYEMGDYAVIKAKLHALLGVFILSDAVEDNSVGGFDVSSDQQVQAEATVTDSEGLVATQRSVTQHFLKPGVAGVYKLPANSKVELAESHTPSAEAKEFMRFLLQICCCALNIPYLFFDLTQGSFSIHRTAIMQYEESCKQTRKANASLRNAWANWQLYMGSQVWRVIGLPAGATPADVLRDCEWVASGMPWFDERDEVEAGISAISAGLQSPQRYCKRRNLDAFKIIDEIAEVNAYAKTKGVALDWGRRPLAAAQPSV